MLKTKKDIKVGYGYESGPGSLFEVTKIGRRVHVNRYIHGEFMDSGTMGVRSFIKSFKDAVPTLPRV